jgi:elongation factor G
VTLLQVPRLVRMHSDEMEDITEAASGEICAMFGVDCYSGDTFSDGTHQLVMTSMHVPTPVMSLAIEPKDRATTAQFSKVRGDCVSASAPLRCIVTLICPRR